MCSLCVETDFLGDCEGLTATTLGLPEASTTVHDNSLLSFWFWAACRSAAHCTAVTDCTVNVCQFVRAYAGTITHVHSATCGIAFAVGIFSCSTKEDIIASR